MFKTVHIFFSGSTPDAAALVRLSGVTIRLMLAIGLVFCTACGYKLAGRGTLPGGVERIAVNILTNRSSETGVEITITNALINELNRRRQGSVVDPDEAEAILEGTIQSLTWDTVSRRAVNAALERRVYGTLSLTLTDSSGKVLWKRSGLKAEQAYAVVEDNKSATESNRRQAIGILAQRLAENVYGRLTDDF